MSLNFFGPFFPFSKLEPPLDRVKMSDEVERIMAKARANREALNRHRKEHQLGQSPIRSPLKDKNEQVLDRQVVETKTTIEDASPVRDGNKETFTKTTITEKEEKIHKRQFVRFTEVSDGSEEGKAEARKRLQQMADKFNQEDAESVSRPRSRSRSRSPIKIETTTTTEMLKSRSRSPSKSPVKITTEAPKIKRTPSPVKSTPIVTSARRTIDNYDEEEFGVNGRRRRLAALAKKFHNYDEDDEAAEQVATPSAADVTKEIDVDEELAEIEEQAQKSATKRSSNLAKDPGFLASLKAQGFEESTSQTKLVYDFSKDPNGSPDVRKTILSSPTKMAAEPRPSSPHKPHPLQFISPQVNKAMANSPMRTAQSPLKSASPVAAVTQNSPMRRAPSPVKPASPAIARCVSPSKPHPLQFVSPKHSTKAAAAPPSKPARSWLETDEATEMKPTWKTEKTLHVTTTPKPPAPAPPPKPPMSEPMTDTASRRSMAEKWSMFEQRTGHGSPEPTEEPETLPLSEPQVLVPCDSY